MIEGPNRPDGLALIACEEHVSQRWFLPASLGITGFPGGFADSTIGGPPPTSTASIPVALECGRWNALRSDQQKGGEHDDGFEFSTDAALAVMGTRCFRWDSGPYLPSPAPCPPPAKPSGPVQCLMRSRCPSGVIIAMLPYHGKKGLPSRTLPRSR